jgi:ATP-binding cassette, subfamily B, bacterial
VTGRPSGWLWMMGHLRPYRRYIAQTMLIVFLIVLINFAVPLTARALVNSGMLAGDREFVYAMIAVQGLLYGSLIVLHYIRGQIAIHVANRLVLQMVAEYIHHVVRLPMAYFNRASNGDVVERIRDFERIQRFSSVELMDVFTAAISLLSLGLLLLWINSSLFVVFGATACAYLAWLLTFSRARRQVDAERFAQDARSRAVEIGIVQAIQDIKIAVQERHSLVEWENVQLLALQTRLRSATLEQRQTAGANLINRIGLIAITFLAAIGVMDGDMTIGDFTIAATISIQLYFQVDQILLFVNKYPETSGAIRRAQEIRDTAAEPSDLPARIPSVLEAPSIALRNVSFAYPGADRLSLSGLSLEVPGGEMAALVGPSGSGKSTMLKLLLSLYQPVEGSILVAGLPLGELDRGAWRSRVGAVMQDGALFATTLGNNIIAGRPLDPSWLDRVIEAAALEDVVSSVSAGIETRVGPGGERLSAGQVQRILIARALYKKPALLLLDEATSALDGLNEATVVSGIRRLLPATTMIVAAHRLGTIREADRIHVVRDGRISEAGTHEALLREDGYYARMLYVGA